MDHRETARHAPRRPIGARVGVPHRDTRGPASDARVAAVRYEELTEAGTIAAVDSEDDAFSPELRSAVLRHVDHLPKKAGTVVRLRFLEGLSQQEIAEALEIPLGTVKSRLAYGLHQLRALLDAPQSPARAQSAR